MALGVYLWQLTIPRYIELYDSGVYFAASFKLVSGVIPYRDFVFVQPPGLALLLTPAALVGRIFGTYDGFAVARAMSALVGAMNAGLLAWLVRRRGVTAMLIAGIGLALEPNNLLVMSSGVRLEPYCVCLVLLGSLALFSPEREMRQCSDRSLAVSGLLFGGAALVKLWAFFPFVAAVVCLFPLVRTRVRVFIGAAAGSFALISLPFVVAAPKNFFSQVIVEQLLRRANPGTGAEVLGTRIAQMTGFSNTSLAPSPTIAVIAFVALALLCAAAFARRTEHEAVDVFLLLASIVTVAGLLAPPEMYSYYSYFAAPFLIGLLSVSLARVAHATRGTLGRLRLSRHVRGFVTGVSALTTVLMIVALLLYATTFYSLNASLRGLPASAVSPITKLIPKGDCVLYIVAGDGVLANRLASSDPDCPNVIDPFGMWFSWGYEVRRPPTAFVNEWKTYLERSQYLVAQVSLARSRKFGPTTWHHSLMPWSKSLESWFALHYVLLSGTNNVYIYKRIS